MFDPGPDGLGESGKKLGTRSRKLITADESTVLTKPVSDSIMVKDGEGDRCFPGPPCADESDGLEVFGESNDLFNQLVPSKTVSRRRWR